MQLVAPLAAGITGAGSGSVGIYRRGTSTRATYYEDFEGTASVTPTANVTLNSSGRVVLYVNELVDCFVYDSGGSSVCEFTAGGAASNVEVNSQSFTGTDYESGSSAASNPVPLSTILDLWKTNAGAIDWKVLVDGTATTLQAALSNLGGLVYNVKNSTYGAVGDGSTDDTVAIQAAITACNAAGGGIVWFPEGTYKTTSVLTVSDKVSLVGAGAHCTTITVDSPTASLMSYSGSTTRVWQELVGLQLLASQANTGAHVAVLSGSLLRISGCDIGSANTDGQSVSLATSTTTRVAISGCTLTCGDGGSAFPFTMSGAAKRVSISDTTFVAPATMGSSALCRGNNIDVTRCRFDFSALTSGTVYGFYANSTTVNATVTSCVFTADGGAGTTTAIYLGTVSATAVFNEDGNNFSCDTAYEYTIAAANVGCNIRLGSRDSRTQTVTISSTPYALSTDQYGVIVATSTVAGNVTLTGTTPPPGARGIVTINNTDGSTRTFTLGGGFAAASHATPGTADVVASVGTNAADIFDYYTTIADPDSPVVAMITRWYLNA